MGESVRFTLTYNRDPPANGPRTVVGKFPSSDPASRATGVGFGNYVREDHPLNARTSKPTPPATTDPEP